MKYCEVEFKITAPADAMQDARDLIAALAGDQGFEAFEETDCGTRGYVQTGAFDGGAIDRLVEDFPMDGVKIAYTIRDAEYRDWNEQWEENGFEPITIGSRCCIHDGRHLPQSHFDITIEINARLAFGTGTHETTRMMVACLLDARLDGKAMLDCGCGTGILAITALKLGAARAVGYDIDEWSVDNARHNSEANNVGGRFTAMQGDANVLDAVDGEFDVVAANINRNILLADMPRFFSKMKKGGLLMLSGFYTEDARLISARAAELGLKQAGAASDNGWACMVFER